MSDYNKLDQMLENDRDLRETVRFHGHLCPGLAIGYRASKACIEQLGVERAEDEEIVVVVENDSCSVDAVQWLTGCTFGKGNFVFRDYGKQAFTFIVRPSGQAVRAALKLSNFPPDQDRETRTCYILNAPIEDIFDIREVVTAVPESARIHDTLICECCKEGVMATRTATRDGLTLCIPCSQERVG